MTWVAISQHSVRLHNTAHQAKFFTHDAGKLVVEASMRLAKSRKVSARPPGK